MRGEDIHRRKMRGEDIHRRKMRGEDIHIRGIPFISLKFDDI